jgi:hypothetical protein
MRVGTRVGAFLTTGLLVVGAMVAMAPAAHAAASVASASAVRVQAGQITDPAYPYDPDPAVAPDSSAVVYTAATSSSATNLFVHPSSPLFEAPGGATWSPRLGLANHASI